MSVANATPPELRLAGELVAQFGHVSTEEAASTVAAHVRRFWDPRMRVRLQQQVAAAGSSCDPVIVRAAEVLAGLERA